MLVESGRSFIDSDTYYNFSSNANANFSSLVNQNRQSNAINIYLLPDNGWSGSGKADGIPGNALVLSGEMANTSVISHEMGHCIGLFHTHSGSGCGDNANCAEQINGSNCSTCGDLICDTPADPCLSGNVNPFTCTYTGGGGYTPDVQNIMSYTYPTCMQHFTEGQIARGHAVIESTTTLLNTILSVSISGPSSLCVGGTATYTLTGLPSGATVTWTALSAEILSSTNSQVTIGYLDPAQLQVHATVATSCGNIELVSNPITAGIGSFIDEIEVYCEDGCAGAFELCSEPNQYSYFNNILTYQFDSSPLVPLTLNYKITTSSSVVFYQNQITVTSASGYLFLPNNIPVGTNHLAVWLSNGPCGAIGDPYRKTIYVVSCNGNNSRMVVYPNPANTELKISYKATGKNELSIIPAKTNTESFSVKLFNKSGKILKEGKTTQMDKNITLQVADLPNDTYYIHIYEGKNVTKKQVVIWH